MKRPIRIFAAIVMLFVGGTASAGRLIRTDAWGGGVVPTFPELDANSLNAGVSGTVDGITVMPTGLVISPVASIYTVSNFTFGPLRDQGTNSGLLVSETNGNYNAAEDAWNGPGGTDAAVFVYTLAQTGDAVGGKTATAADDTIGNAYLGGDTEVQVNYGGPLTGGLFIDLYGIPTGPASFTYGGVTYQSIGNSAPVNFANDFFFNSAGALVGFLNDNGTFVASSTMIPASGWQAVTAPEIDPKSVAGAFTLLAGSLSVLVARRRRVNAKLY